VVNHHHEVPFRLLEKKYTFTGNEGVRANSTDNKIIHGDNLEALKSLLPEFEGKVNCIYIDPPYNTGNEGWVYNDAVNDPKIKKWLGQVVGKEGEDLSRHDKWLCMMYPRLKLLHRLLAKNGVFFLQLNDDELHYAKVLMDEIFGRDSYINEVCVKMKLTAGASGGGEDKRLKKNIENILIYTKDRTGEGGFEKFNDVYDEEDLFEFIEGMKEDGKSWKYTRIVKSFGEKQFYKTIVDGSGEPIDIYLHKNVDLQPISSVATSEGISEQECYKKYFRSIFRDTNAQSSIRTRVMEAVAGASDFVSIEYTPRSGKSKGKKTTLYYKGNNCDLLAWLSDIAYERNGRLVKLEKAGTYWDGFPLNNLTKEGGIQFPSGKKPILLIDKILRLATTKNSIVLDSFAGSGTTAHAVLSLNSQDGGNRRFITCEMMDYAETITAERIRRVIDGYGEGNKVVAGTGGGFDFFKIGEALFKEDKNLNEEVGVEAIRGYVAHTENIPTEKRWDTENAVSPYALGSTDTSLCVFYYEKDRVTTLDIDFLGQLKIKNLPSRPEQFVIYADKCALDKDFLYKHGITFKRIPRDITRF